MCKLRCVPAALMLLPPCFTAATHDIHRRLPTSLAASCGRADAATATHRCQCPCAVPQPCLWACATPPHASNRCWTSPASPAAPPEPPATYTSTPASNSPLLPLAMLVHQLTMQPRRALLRLLLGTLQQPCQCLRVHRPRLRSCPHDIQAASPTPGGCQGAELHGTDATSYRIKNRLRFRLAGPCCGSPP